MSPYPSSEKMGGVGELHSEIRCEEQFQCKWTYMTFILLEGVFSCSSKACGEGSPQNNYWTALCREVS